MEKNSKELLLTEKQYDPSINRDSEAIPIETVDEKLDRNNY